MEILAIILALVIGFIVLKFISGMIKFVVLGVIVLGIFYFITLGFGARPAPDRSRTRTASSPTSTASSRPT